MTDRLKDEERVKAKWPKHDVRPIWTSRGWRIIAVPPLGGECIELGRTSSGHVPESEAWADAASRLETK